MYLLVAFVITWISNRKDKSLIVYSELFFIPSPYQWFLPY